MSSLVSIILPAYQAATTIERTIQSIIAQTHTNWELIICIDAATDDTEQTALAAAQNEKRIRLMVSNKNRGVVRSRNLAIRLAKGSFLAFCDADDWWCADKLSLQLKGLNASQANFSYTSATYVSSDGLWHSKPARMPSSLNLKRLYLGNPIGLSTALYDLSVIGKCYFEKLPEPFIHEDYAYWIQLFRHPLVKANYVAYPTTNVLIQPSTRSGNKRLALQSQWYILRNIAGLSAFPAFCCLLTYLFFAFYKRGWKTWKEQLIPQRQGH
jgi:teichuronic acid biosynthesis glycosyltransferase TuaG